MLDLAVAYAFDTQTFYEQRNCFKGTCFGEVPSSIVGAKNISYLKKGFITFDFGESQGACRQVQGCHRQGSDVQSAI